MLLTRSPLDPLSPGLPVVPLKQKARLCCHRNTRIIAKRNHADLKNFSPITHKVLMFCSMQGHTQYSIILIYTCEAEISII